MNLYAIIILHVQRFVSQFCLQLHLTIFSKLSGAAGRSVYVCSNLFCTRDHPQSFGCSVLSGFVHS